MWDITMIPRVEVNGGPINYNLCPEKFRGGLERYIEYGIDGGDFLTAFLEGDLFGALGRADHETRYMLHDIAVFLYNYCPRCYGSPEAVSAWKEHRRELIRNSKEAAAS